MLALFIATVFISTCTVLPRTDKTSGTKIGILKLDGAVNSGQVRFISIDGDTNEATNFIVVNDCPLVLVVHGFWVLQFFTMLNS